MKRDFKAKVTLAVSTERTWACLFTEQHLFWIVARFAQQNMHLIQSSGKYLKNGIFFGRYFFYSENIFKWEHARQIEKQTHTRSLVYFTEENAIYYEIFKFIIYFGKITGVLFGSKIVILWGMRYISSESLKTYLFEIFYSPSTLDSRNYLSVDDFEL